MMRKKTYIEPESLKPEKFKGLSSDQIYNYFQEFLWIRKNSAGLLIKLALIGFEGYIEEEAQ